jgi:hypothetical protein
VQAAGDVRPSPDVALDEALRPLVRFAEEGAAIAMLAEDDDLAEDYEKNSLYEAVKLLAQRATAKQLNTAILAFVASPEQLDAAINPTRRTTSLMMMSNHSAQYA